MARLEEHEMAILNVQTLTYGTMRLVPCSSSPLSNKDMFCLILLIFSYFQRQYGWCSMAAVWRLATQFYVFHVPSV
jgi:hypothetical protein